MSSFAPFLDGYHDVANQLSDHIRRRADRTFAASDADRAAAATTDAFEARRQRLRAGMLEAIGGLPDLSPAVPATVCGVVEGSEFVVERLLLETLPGVLATANLYLPGRGGGRAGDPAGPAGPAGPSAARSGPGAQAEAETVGAGPSGDRRPAVLFLCGHAREAKAHPEYQRVCRALARAGIAVLALDPVGQGERLQYLEPGTGAERVGWGTTEHSYAGFACSAGGGNIARHFVADAMAALSYLAGRPEVDAGRLGVTGNSGGGTQAAYLTFLDDRLACAAPCTYITSRQAYMATGQPHDAEQNLWRAVAMGLDYADLASGLAPKPLLLGAVASDFFCIEGTLAALADLERIYGLYGRGADLHLAVAPGRHAFSDVLRELVVRFFRRHLAGEAVALPPGLISCASAAESPLGEPWPCAPEPSDDIPPEALLVTATGQVALSHPAARTVFDLQCEAWRARPRPSEREAADRLRAAVLAGRPRPALWVRETASGPGWAHRYTMSEPDIAVPMIVLAPDGSAPDGPLTVGALAEGTPAVAARPDLVARLLQRAGRLLLFDARGCGAAAQRAVNPRRPDGVHGTPHKLNFDSMMLGDSLLAMRAFDALRVLEYAHRIAPAVAVAGEGGAGLALLCAAFLDGGVRGGRFAGLPASFADWVTQRYFEPDYGLETFGITAWPDVGRLLAASGAEAVAEL